MATQSQFNCFAADPFHKIHDFSSDQVKVALTNSAPSASNTVLANITEISYTNCSSRNVTTSSSAQTAGVYKLTLADLVLTATGGSVGPFRYVVVFNDTAASKNLMTWIDYGSAISINDGESFTIDFNAANGLLQST